ncbi:BirA family transcriptional regulator, biotin operon repressor / biotin-[acetyl-CoA-carboxylase] ligase [Paenibacillus algorifonticola]|uniref:Bifunctional ligase/repressor BirA n=1 Tax=Paenibacillus algorifonticola TaxID=684063 RepID=A0A1I2ED61_9BACL|nr:biotin--[acetyl-CoA-carboxylase] ligase [Paenibacillus algorifonticola]SFE90583.1 BirA family transcriptional regulator, biotin operon repressor / biotin-[acetyl-CoA-carboxylase] ligase [Paenibacillus algorifonticola]
MSHENLLRLFAEREGEYVSGEHISRELKVSRTAIWKQIRKLESQGYEFEASRRLGYRLLSMPDKLDLAALLTGLKTKRFGQKLQVLESVESTQNIAQSLAEAGAEEGTLVVAEQQLSGRGRMGRGWISPLGKGIWMSMVMRPMVPIYFAPQLTLLTAVALCRSLKRLTKLDIGIKWPNDLLIDGKKISGILLESAAEDERLRYVIAGIGISVNLQQADYPEELLEKATSLRLASGEKQVREAIIADFLLEWEQLYELYQNEGFAPIVTLWESLSLSLHKPATLITPQGVVEGTPRGLDASGALIVEKPDGSQALIFSAEMGEPRSK